MNYHILREFADSWMLLAMFLFFLGCIFWAFRPGSRKAHDEASQQIFRNEQKPVPDRTRDEEAR